MGPTTTVAIDPQPAAPNVSIWAQGDAVWAEKLVKQRETDVAMDWPETLLEAFGLRMAIHGMRISRNMMMCDRRYAVQQLMSAFTLKDDELHDLAAKLFFHFEERQTGRPPLH
ncbi:hypothetical protein LPB72_07565 [Hydrogenophaga crassostreae]|uniref:Uncharacterized protein n=1 Tax=Hydrogenophaga crassostreae TaxID=1763535 RepID=A0A162T2S4_9BURK|nr:hypothetical protein [Hydrogenophaga crassostreae]AOW13101.1 hypothetical protein LPB072_09805 [Hydrogenophaga crassostreae]OAD42753.1 hypothetical protein LPB72_07565 [Hydrogenophaga crassostreae]